MADLEGFSFAGLSLQIAADHVSIKALEGEWTELERCTPEATGFQSHGWCMGWIESNCLGHRSPKPLVIVVRERGRPVWLLPLQVEQLYGIRWGRALGQPLTQYADALALESPRRPLWRAAADNALKKVGLVDVIAMVQVRADSVLAKVPGSSFVKSASCTAPFLDLTNEAAVSACLVLRGSLRRRHSALTLTGPISFEVVKGRDERAQAALEALHLKLQWLRGRHLHGSWLTTQAAQRFFERLAASGQVEVCRLRVAAGQSAVEIGFTHRAIYRSLLSAFDLRYAYGSPGHLLTRRVIEDCRSRGLRQIDLSAPAEPYKMAISSGSADIVSIHLPVTLLGRVGMFASLNFRRFFYDFNEWRYRTVVWVRQRGPERDKRS